MYVWMHFPMLVKGRWLSVCKKHLSIPLPYSFNTYSNMHLQRFTPMCKNQEQRETQSLCSSSCFKTEFVMRPN